MQVIQHIPGITAAVSRTWLWSLGTGCSTWFPWSSPATTHCKRHKRLPTILLGIQHTLRIPRNLSALVHAQDSDSVLASILKKAWKKKIKSNQIFHYTRCIKPMRVTSWRGPSARQCARAFERKKQRQIFPEIESEKPDRKGGQCKENNTQTNVARSEVLRKTQIFNAWGKNLMLSMYKSLCVSADKTTYAFLEKSVVLEGLTSTVFICSK